MKRKDIFIYMLIYFSVLFKNMKASLVFPSCVCLSLKPWMQIHFPAQKLLMISHCPQNQVQVCNIVFQILCDPPPTHLSKKSTLLATVREAVAECVASGLRFQLSHLPAVASDKLLKTSLCLSLLDCKNVIIVVIIWTAWESRELINVSC